MADANTVGRRGVYVKPGLLDVGTCARIRAAMDEGVAEPAEVYAGGYVVDEQVRQTLDVSVSPAIISLVEHGLDDVRLEVADFFGVRLSAAEGPGFLRYLPGGFYRVHQDAGGESSQFPRRISLVLFLTNATKGPTVEPGSCAGGSLRLWCVDRASESDPLDLRPEMGTLIAFPSGLPHEVLPVTAGVRDVVVDWFY